MAAATLSISFSVDPQHHNHHFFKPHKTFPITSPPQFPKYPLPLLLKSDRYLLKSSSSSSSTTTTVSPSLSYLSDSLRTGRFLTNEELEKLKFLEDFAYSRELRAGYLWVRAMRAQEMDVTVALLAESFAESMLLPSAYNSFLRFLVKQYLIERRAVMPHAVTLVGFFRERKRKEEDDDEEEAEVERLAGTVEVCFDKRGANASPPTPTPPKTRLIYVT